jgi:DNA polymerase elongation subunit (family B)
VDILYTLRLNYLRSDPMNYTAKLLLNSLYGRFGMDDKFPEIKIFSSKKSFNDFTINLSGDILETIPLGQNRILVKYLSDVLETRTMLYGNLETHNVSVAIAAAITAYARIHMSQFKNNPNFKLYYTDTDSAYLDRPLPDHLVSSTELGKFKLESVIDKAIFLSPKVYFLKTEEGKTIFKVKGLKHNVVLTFEDFNNLLFKES